MFSAPIVDRRSNSSLVLPVFWENPLAHTHTHRMHLTMRLEWHGQLRQSCLDASLNLIIPRQDIFR